MFDTLEVCQLNVRSLECVQVLVLAFIYQLLIILISW